MATMPSATRPLSKAREPPEQTRDRRNTKTISFLCVVKSLWQIGYPGRCKTVDMRVVMMTNDTGRSNRSYLVGVTATQRNR